MLTLISAPAGFGKTTLLSDWIHQSEMPVAWFSLDEGDNDPVRFLSYVIAALQTIEANIGKPALSALQSPQAPPMESILATLINDINPVSKDFALILEDYHLIDTHEIHNIVEFLLDHLPQQMHLVIATRADPPLPVARLRGQNQLSEFRASDLCFTADESSVFFNKVMNLGLSPDEIGMLESRTEGWIAGLQLAALSMEGRKDIPAFIKAFTGDDRHIVDYLMEEVLSRQSETVQSFLLRTSILDRLSGPLCDAVTGQNDSQQMLQKLEKANLFVVPLDSKRLWYRYHHLFTNFLRTRLYHAQRDLIPELNRRACQWYADNGLVSEAISHALAAEDFERVADLIEQVAQTMVARGEFTTLLRWLKALPDPLVRARPQLCLAHAWALFINEQFEAAESRLQDVETGCKAQISRIGKPELEALLGEAAAIRAIIAHVQEDNLRAIELSHQALQRLPDKNLYLRSLIAWILGMAHQMIGDVVAARQAYAEARTISQRTEHGPTLLPLNGLAELEVIQGHLHQAAKLFQQALRFAAEHDDQRGVRIPIAGVAHIGMGQLLYEWDDLEGATRYLLEGIELAKQFGYSVVLADGYVGLARVKQAQGDVNGALDMLQQAEQLAQRSHAIWTIAQIAGCQARLWLFPPGGSLAAAARWAQEYRLADELSYLRKVEYLALARVFIALGRADEALGLLTRLQEAAEVARRMESIIEILMLRALALEAQDDTIGAMLTLIQALSLAEPEGYIRIFVDEGKPMADLLEKVIEAKQVGQGDAKIDVPQAYVKKLLMILKVSPVPQPEGSLAQALSERELEVLTFVAAGLPNSHIARELFISVNTVKTHIKNINSKLDVHSRTQATARAKEIGLL